jgi:tetratricopeptide (TPR) repeat protein
LSDIFGGDGGGPTNESVPSHPFHGDSAMATGGAAPPGPAPGAPGAGADGLLDFIQNAGAPTAPSRQQMFRIRKRSGEVVGPYDESSVLQMIQSQQLQGNEEASTDGNTWRPIGQVSAFKEAIQQAMAAALGGLDLPGLQDAELPGLRGETDLPGLAGDLPGLRDKDTGMAPTGELPAVPGEPGAPQEQQWDAGPAKLHPSIVRKRRRRKVVRLVAGVTLLVVVAGGASLQYVTDWGAFGYVKIMELVKGKEPVDDKPDTPALPDLPKAKVPASQLLSQDTYVAYRQGAELQQKIVEAGKSIEPFPPAAAKAAAEQARFLSYLVVVEEMGVFAAQLTDALTLAPPGSPGRVVGEAAAAYAKDKFKEGIERVKPFTDPDKGLPKDALAEMHVWVGLGHVGLEETKEAQAAFDAALQAQTDHRAALYQQAALLSRLGEPDAALGYADKLLEIDGDHPRALLLKGQLLSGVAETRDAGDALLTALSEGKKGPDAAPIQRARAFMGRAEISVGKLEWEGALKHMNAAVDVVPQNREVRLKHGELALKLREFGLARQSFKKLVEINGDDVGALVGLARAKIGSRDALGGYSDLQAFIEKRQDDPVLTYWFGVAARELLKLEEARKHFERSRQLDNKWAQPPAELILDLLDQGKLKQALDLASKAEAEVDAGQRHVIRATKAAIFMRQRNYKLAEKELEQALAEDPRDIEARVRFVELLVTTRHLKKASQHAREARQHDPKNPSVIAASGIVEAARGDHRRALELFEEATGLAPNDHRLYLHAAASAIALEDFGRAKTFVDAAGQLQPKNPEVMNYRGQVMRATDPKQAVTIFREAIELSPEDPRLRYQLGVTFQNMGLNLEAKDTFQDAINIDPSFADAFHGRGMSLRELGRNNEARQAFKEVTRLDNTRADAHIQIAEILAALGDPKGSINSYKSAMSADPESAKPVCEMGLMLVQSLGNERKFLKQGVEALQRCVKLDDGYPSALRKLGDGYRDVGKRKEAIAMWKQHMDTHPDDANNASVCESLKQLGSKCE